MNGVSSIDNQVQQFSYAHHQALREAGQRYDAQRQKMSEIAADLTKNIVSSVKSGAAATNIGMNIDTKA